MTMPDAPRDGWLDDWLDGGSGCGAASHASERPDRPATIHAERRQEEDSLSGLWTESESRATDCASKASSTAPSRSSAARFKQAWGKLEHAVTVPLPSKPKKNSVGSSGDIRTKETERKTKKERMLSAKTSTNIVTLTKTKTDSAMSDATPETTNVKKATKVNTAKARASKNNGSIRSSRSSPASVPVATKSLREGTPKKGLISDDESSYTSHSSRSSTYSEASPDSQNESYMEDSTVRTDASNSASHRYGNMVKNLTMNTGASNSVSVQYSIMDPEHQLMVMATDHGNSKKLVVQEQGYIPKPNRPDQVVIVVHCSTITLRDCMIRLGKWSDMQKLPFVPGSDIVGTIFSMGDEAFECSTFEVGDKVAAVVSSGGNAKYITLPYQRIMRVPSETDSVMALCLISTYAPAREALGLARKFNTPFTGANILVIGGNGPSSLATIELALLEGANVFTTADERHHGYLSGLGARCFPIDSKRWLPALEGKMDVVIDSLCLDGYESSSLALSSAGTLVCTGTSAVYTQGQIQAFGVGDIRDYLAMYYKMKAKYILGKTIFYDKVERYDRAPDEYSKHFLYLCHLVSKNSFIPRVSSCSPLNLVASTQRAIEKGGAAYGVCVCTPWTTKVGPSTSNVLGGGNS